MNRIDRWLATRVAWHMSKCAICILFHFIFFLFESTTARENPSLRIPVYWWWLQINNVSSKSKLSLEKFHCTTTWRDNPGLKNMIRTHVEKPLHLSRLPKAIVLFGNKIHIFHATRNINVSAHSTLTFAQSSQRKREWKNERDEKAKICKQ